MAKSERKSSSKKQVATTSSPTIEEQTAAFLKSGGKIDMIPSGVSGQTNMAGPKHINLGNKSAEKPQPPKS